MYSIQLAVPVQSDPAYSAMDEDGGAWVVVSATTPPLVLRCTQAWCDVTGYDDADVVGRPLCGPMLDKATDKTALVRVTCIHRPTISTLEERKSFLFVNFHFCFSCHVFEFQSASANLLLRHFCPLSLFRSTTCLFIRLYIHIHIHSRTHIHINKPNTHTHTLTHAHTNTYTYT